MTSMALDTHAYYKKLIATGLSETQAEAIASGLINGLTDNLATKDELHSELTLVRADMGAMEERLEGKIALVRSDMVAMEDRLRGEIGELRGELRGEMNELRAEMGAMEARLIRWSAVGLLTVIAVNLAMMGVMFNLLQP